MGTLRGTWAQGPTPVLSTTPTDRYPALAQGCGVEKPEKTRSCAQGTSAPLAPSPRESAQPRSPSQRSPKEPISTWSSAGDAPCPIPRLQAVVPHQPPHRRVLKSRVDQVGQSHTGHGRAATATRFPQPCPRPSSRTPLPSPPLLKRCYHLYCFAAFAYKRSNLPQGKALPWNKDNLKLDIIMHCRTKYAKKHANAQTHTLLFGHCNSQVQLLNWSDHHQMGANACTYSHTDM